jgi:hypothetical protein
VADDDTDIAAHVTRPQAVHPTLIVLEATGGYQRAVVAALATAGLPWRSSIPAKPVTLPVGQRAERSWLATRSIGPWPSAP